MKIAFCSAVLSLSLTSWACSQDQQSNTNAPSPRAAPVGRSQLVRPVQQMQMQRPSQMVQSQRPGQVMQGRPSGGGQARLARPGVVRGPAGAFHTTMPANVTHNPAHVAGRAGGRYNRQAFTFRRDGHFYRRAYYLGPGGAVFFYDETLPDDDPAVVGMPPDSLPTCPEDADDCQGFNDPASGPAQIDPRSAAL